MLGLFLKLKLNDKDYDFFLLEKKKKKTSLIALELLIFTLKKEFKLAVHIGTTFLGVL